MKETVTQQAMLWKTQINKKRLLEREIAWVRREFKDIHTEQDIDLYNVERYAVLHLRANFI